MTRLLDMREYPDSASYFLDQQILLWREAKYRKGDLKRWKSYGERKLQNKGKFVESIELIQFDDYCKELTNQKLCQES